MFASTADAEGKRRAERLAAALAELGLRVDVEPRASLAVIVAGEASMARLADAALRRTVLERAREQGFTHVAIEVAAG